MLRLLTEEEMREHRKTLRKFVGDNHCEMYNVMMAIERYIKQGAVKEEHRIIKLIKKLKIDKDIENRIIIKIMEEPTRQRYDRVKKHRLEVMKKTEV